MVKGERHAKRPEGAPSSMDAREQHAKRLKRLQDAVARRSGRGVHAAATEVVRAAAGRAAVEECARLLALAMVRTEMLVIYNEASMRLVRFWRMCEPVRTFKLVQKYKDEGPTIDCVKSIRFVWLSCPMREH